MNKWGQMHKAFVLLFMLLLSEIALAGPSMTASIEKVRVRPTVTYIKLAGCPKYNRIYLDTEYGKAMYSAALTAATAGKKVQVEFLDMNGCQLIESEFVFLEVKY